MATETSTRPPVTAAAPAAAPRQIRSARELHAALTAGDPVTRLSTRKAVMARPDAALAFGLHAGQDVIDILLQQAARTHGQIEWLSWLGALAAFREPRVTACFTEVLSTAKEPEILFLAARYLAQESMVSLHPVLAPLLLQNTSVARARAVAEVLAGCAVLSPAERLRVALLAPADGPAVPRLDATTADCWLAELHGPFRLEAQTELEAQGAPAFAGMCGRWEHLADETREWLLGWGVRESLPATHELLQYALVSGSDRIALVALEGLTALRHDVSDCMAALTCFADHHDAMLRRAAIVAGATGIDWRQSLAQDPNPAVRLVCVPRLVAAEGLRALPDLLALVQEPDWQMRAIVTQALISLGAAVVEAVKPLVHAPDHGVRVAAVQVLLALDQDVWVAEQILPGVDGAHG